MNIQLFDKGAFQPFEFILLVCHVAWVVFLSACGYVCIDLVLQSNPMIVQKMEEPASNGALLFAFLFIIMWCRK